MVCAARAVALMGLQHVPPKMRPEIVEALIRARKLVSRDLTEVNDRPQVAAFSHALALLGIMDHAAAGTGLTAEDVLKMAREAYR